MAKKKRKRSLHLVPRLGPATNLRPAGAHETAKVYNRKLEKIALRREIAQGDFHLEAPR
jgi:hypothetical protein